MIKIQNLNNYDKQLNQLGITEEKEQKKIIEFFYRFGKIIYDFKIESYGKKN